MESLYLTHEGVRKLRQELNRLVNVVRPQAAHDLAVAREKGDLSENAEYDAAREKLTNLDRRIGELQAKFAYIQIVDENELNTDEVRILSKVTLINTKTKAEITYTVVDPVQADPMKKLISIKSPIAQGLLGKKVGEKAIVSIPSGEITFKIKSIELSEGL